MSLKNGGAGPCELVCHRCHCELSQAMSCTTPSVLGLLRSQRRRLDSISPVLFQNIALAEIQGSGRGVEAFEANLLEHLATIFTVVCGE